MDEWQIERLDASHKREAFTCGKAPLDEFLRALVSQYEKRRLGRTYDAVRPGDKCRTTNDTSFFLSNPSKKDSRYNLLPVRSKSETWFIGSEKKTGLAGRKCGSAGAADQLR